MPDHNRRPREPDDFRKLLRGEIDSEEYVRRLRERVREARTNSATKTKPSQGGHT